jgi:DivIVA domain-containing protein
VTLVTQMSWVGLFKHEIYGNLFRAPAHRSAPDSEVVMEITTDIECREFTVVKRGYDPDEVRSFLKELAEAGLKPSPVFAEVGDQVAELLETAHRMAASVETQARVDADLVLEAAAAAAAEQLADAEARRLEAEAAVTAASERATQLVADAEAIAANVTAENERAITARREAADELLRERATTVIEGANLRLRKLLDAEREVHARLSAAFAGVNANPEAPLERDDEELLDHAFQQFFSEEIETEPSRSWILSD